jgi:hypothetical protein
MPGEVSNPPHYPPHNPQLSDAIPDFLDLMKSFIKLGAHRLDVTPVSGKKRESH